IRTHKIRSALTITGIVIGVTSVISVASIIDGLNKFVQSKIESLGSRTFFVARFPAGQDPNRMPLKYRLRKYIDYGDAEHVRASCPHVESATTFGTRAFFLGQHTSISSGSQRVERLFLRGAAPDFGHVIPAFDCYQGR